MKEKKLEYERELTMLEVAGLSEVEEAITALEVTVSYHDLRRALLVNVYRRELCCDDSE
ncbi:unnamed protein product [Symbiodinium natans]|uniref:Uncharacterized protein n=1 Tax=Symbiodinium natans TaxID=878477 RepID=A0A812IFL8_9DINO|nr:unnamed protein product [Symbiodinium natans]